MTEQCGTCLFFKVRSDNSGKHVGGGFCRRFPPFYPSGQQVWPSLLEGRLYDIEPSNNFLNDAWPMVHQQSWCGEYRAAKAT